jgi:PAS domain S-box-containing protein
MKVPHPSMILRAVRRVLRSRTALAMWLLRYGLAPVLVATALVVSLLLQPIAPQALVYPFLAAVVASAWLGGTGPGLFAALLATTSLDYFFLPPLYTLGIGREAWPYVLPFLLSALAAAWMSSTRRLAETAKAEGARLAAAAEQAAEAIVITDACGNIQYVNPAFTRMTGYSPEEAIGRNPRLLKSGNQDPAFYKDLWKTILGGKVWQGELTNRRKDCTTYTEDMTIAPVRDSQGTITNFIAIKQDATARKEWELSLAERARLAELGAEIGTALTGAATLREGLQECAESLVLHLGAAFARIWTLNEATQVLELEASTGLYTHIDGGHGRVPVGKFKIGRIAENGEPHLTNTVSEDSWWATRNGRDAKGWWPSRATL